MRYLKCQCGKAERWDTGEVVHPCQGCKECGTTYATNPKGHAPLQPHTFEPRYDERTGEQNRRMCKLCHYSEKTDAPSQ